MANWSATVLVDGVQVHTSGLITVKAERNTNKIASFAIVPAAGAQYTPSSLIGKPVVIKYDTTTIFTGWVEDAPIDLQNRRIQVTANDGFTLSWETRTEAQILAAIPGGKYHSAYFGDRQSGWGQTQDVLETVQKDAHFNATGTLVIAPWWGTPTITLTPGEIIDGSVSVEHAQRSELINSITAQVDVLWDCWKQRHGTYAWSWSTDPAPLCAWIEDPFRLPSADMVHEAARGTEWPQLDGIQFQTFPKAGTLNCQTAIQWDPQDRERTEVTGANWTCFKRWSWKKRARQTISMTCPTSIALYGEIRAEDGCSSEYPSDAASWENDKTPYTPGWDQDILGDWYQDQVDMADVTALLECMLAVFAHRIRKSHRQNFTTFSTLCMPGLDLADTITLNSTRVTATGDVYAYEHQLDTTAGRRHTIISIVGSAGGGSLTGSDLTNPPIADTSPTWGAAIHQATLPTHVGNSQTSENYDEDWTGFVTNFIDQIGTPQPEQIYPDEGLRVPTFEIEDQSRSEYTASYPIDLVIGVPDDTLITTPIPIPA